VTAEVWRASLLTSSERRGHKQAKSAARLICRQIIKRFGSLGCDKQTNNDSAEAILIGWWALHHFALANSSSKCKSIGPLVDRYINGDVVR